MPLPDILDDPAIAIAAPSDRNPPPDAHARGLWATSVPSYIMAWLPYGAFRKGKGPIKVMLAKKPCHFFNERD